MRDMAGGRLKSPWGIDADEDPRDMAQGQKGHARCCTCEIFSTEGRGGGTGEDIWGGRGRIASRTWGGGRGRRGAGQDGNKQQGVQGRGRADSGRKKRRCVRRRRIYGAGEGG